MFQYLAHGHRALGDLVNEMDEMARLTVYLQGSRLP